MFYGNAFRFCSQLGEKFKDSDTVVVAKMDATANELEHTKITSFPTLKLYAKGDNKVKYIVVFRLYSLNPTKYISKKYNQVWIECVLVDLAELTVLGNENNLLFVFCNKVNGW